MIFTFISNRPSNSKLGKCGEDDENWRTECWIHLRIQLQDNLKIHDRRNRDFEEKMGGGVKWKLCFRKEYLKWEENLKWDRTEKKN